MVLLLPFAVLSVLGFGIWLLGSFFEYTGIAAIGAVIIIALGGAVVLTDLSVRTGVTVEKNHTVVDGETVVANETRTFEYQPVGIISEFGETGQLSLGGLQMLVGGLLMSRKLNEVAT